MHPLTNVLPSQPHCHLHIHQKHLPSALRSSFLVFFTYRLGCECREKLWTWVVMMCIYISLASVSSLMCSMMSCESYVIEWQGVVTNCCRKLLPTIWAGDWHPWQTRLSATKHILAHYITFGDSMVDCYDCYDCSWSFTRQVIDGRWSSSLANGLGLWIKHWTTSWSIYGYLHCVCRPKAITTLVGQSIGLQSVTS